MKIILHIGQSKTGTSTLQKCFYASRDYLAQRSVLYPESPYKSTKHKIFTALHHGKGRGRNAQKRKLFTSDRLKMREAWLSSLKVKISQTKPNALILSSESMFSITDRDYVLKLKDSLDIFNPIEIIVVAYIRKPSLHYISSLQQQMKGSYKIRKFVPIQYKKVIDNYVNVFGRNSVHVNCFDRRTLYQGDLIADFVTKYLNDLDIDHKSLVSIKDKNISLSAEAIFILRKYREDNYPETDNIFFRDTGQLIQTLRSIDMEMSNPRPALKPAFADIVDYASSDPLWLKTEFGVVFPGYDYSRVSSDGQIPQPQRPAQTRLSDILEIDPVVLDGIIKRLEVSEWIEAETGFQRLRNWMVYKGEKRILRRAWLEEFRNSLAV